MSADALAPANDRGFFGHPRGLSTLFFTEMWERFSYYGIRALLILYMTAAVDKHGMGLSVAIAGAIYGLYTSCAYIFALPAGWRVLTAEDRPSAPGVEDPVAEIRRAPKPC